MIVQIYEIQTPAEAADMIALGVDQPADRQAQIKRRFPEIGLMRSIPIARHDHSPADQPSTMAALCM